MRRHIDLSKVTISVEQVVKPRAITEIPNDVSVSVYAKASVEELPGTLIVVEAPSLYWNPWRLARLLV
jgi:hypothetical protein